MRHRPLSVGPIRAFEAVARRLSFRAAAEELHLTQSAVSRQISALEDEVGAALLTRGTRQVALTAEGANFLRAVEPSLARLDSSVQQIRRSRGRRVVNLSTFASLASLWLLPRLEDFQRDEPEIDIRIATTDALVDLQDGEVDLVLRHCRPVLAPSDGIRLFGEVVTPVISPWLQQRIASGDAPPLTTPADLAGHLLAENEGHRHGVHGPGWRQWLEQHGQPQLEPQRWMYVNYTYQQVQTALAGRALALVPLPMVADAIHRGELIEPFGRQGRLPSEHAYWLLTAPGSALRDEVQRLHRWLLANAVDTRVAMGQAEPSPAGTSGTVNAPAASARELPSLRKKTPGHPRLS